MQIKEFKEKEVDVKDKSLSNKVYFAVGGIVLAVILIVAVFIKVNEFDIRDYIKPVYTGADGYASVTFVVDEDALSNKLLGKKADDDKKYYVRKFIESINVYTTDTDIKNGDKVHCEIEFNDTYADNAGADINKKQYTYKAKGINAGAKIDIYSGVDVTFSGISPDARVIIDNDWDDDYLKTLTFTADKASSIKLNDSIMVSCDVSYEDMARHGILIQQINLLLTAMIILKLIKMLWLTYIKRLRKLSLKKQKMQPTECCMWQQATQITCIILMKKMYLMSILMRRISLRLWQQDRKRIIILSFRHRLL